MIVEIFWPKFVALLFMYIFLPMLFVVWKDGQEDEKIKSVRVHVVKGIYIRRSSFTEYSQVLICFIIMPLGLSFFNNNDYHDFVKALSWGEDDTYRYLRVCGYSVVFGIGGKDIIKNVYKMATGNELKDPSARSEKIQSEISQTAAPILRESEMKKYGERAAIDLLALFNSHNSQLRFDLVEVLGVEGRDLLHHLMSFNGVVYMGDIYYLYALGRDVLEAKARGDSQ